MMANSKARSPDDWLVLLQKFAVCDLSVAAFCRQEGISEYSFYKWRNQLTLPQLPPAQQDDTPSFVELGSLNSPATNCSRLDIRLELGSGLVLHLVRS
jgi:hypothetical protein